MLRYLLILLVVIVGVLAVIFDDHLWLRVGAGVAIVGGLGLLGWQFWSASREEEEEGQSPSESKAPSESLEDLGIVDIRPEDARSPESGARAQSSRTGEGEREPSSSDSGSSRATPATEPPSEVGRAHPATSGTDGTASARQSVVTEEASVLGPFLESLRAALGAQTVCLLVQEEVALTYRIEALASTHTQVQRSGTFDTQTPLLTATMSRQSVSVRPLTEARVAIEDLGYYDDPPEVIQLAVAPVPQPDAPSATFLVADAPAHSDLGSSRARTLLEHFAETVALLSASEEPEGEQSPVQADGEETHSSSEGASGTEGEEVPRPRREIIAEEMKATKAASEDLALALVHLNRAESIARRGKEAVVSAERLLRARLEQMSPSHRVERFGELTYGIFFRGDADRVEPWATDLEATMAQEEGELEGGVSVGVAVWGESREDPEALRADATEALHEAYKTGACTIVT